MSRIRAAALAAVLLLSGCLSGRIYPSQMSERLQYKGFSFARPPSESWFIDPDQETPTEVVVYREVAEPHHSVFVGFSLFRPTTDFPRDPDGFTAWSKQQDLAAKSVTRFRSFTLEPLVLQGQTCVSEKSDADVTSARFPGEPLRMLTHSITCIHPAFEKTLVMAMYSERGSPDGVGLDPSIAAEGEQILGGFEIDVAAGTPAR